MSAEIARLRVPDVTEGAKVRVPRPPYDVLVVRAGGRWRAIEDACPHSGWSLSEGELVGERVVCAGHGWEICVRTGRVCVPAGLDEANPVFHVRREGDELVVYEPRSG